MAYKKEEKKRKVISVSLPKEFYDSLMIIKDKLGLTTSELCVLLMSYGMEFCKQTYQTNQEKEEN